MGASTFSDSVAKGRGTRTAQEAFRALQDDARHEYGHNGYTGTIAECDGFRIMDPHAVAFRHAEAHRAKAPNRCTCKRARKIRGTIPTIEEAAALSNYLIDEDKTLDKYGPAGSFEIRRKGGRTVAGWLFFGWAAS